jgi:NTP pyrophosphatase (non-canonical NTP hydrolase)
MSDVLMSSYQEQAMEFAAYDASPEHLGVKLYPFLALAEEAGEVCGKVAKAMRKGDFIDRDAVALELGDVLWQIAACADELGIGLEDVAVRNLNKLIARQKAGTIVGEGDNR